MTPDDVNPLLPRALGEGLQAADRLAALRIIDANFNRASEGLRVVEELCRFALNDRHLTEGCKQLRHDLTAALEALPGPQLHAARDTEGDPGTTVATAREGSRHSLADVAAANWRRVEQALRAIEEYAKLLAPDLATRIEQFRYRAYTLAKACTTTADSRLLLENARLYALLDGGRSADDLAQQARQLIAAGIHVLQLRDKSLSARELLGRARVLRTIISETAVSAPEVSGSPAVAPHQAPLLIVNDFPDIAALARADGVHLGQDDLTVHDARRVTGASLLIGVSTHTIEQARQAVLDGANYIGCGPTFPSGTKHFDRFPGLEFLRQVAAEISLPAFAIGGIDRSNVGEVLATGMSRLAISGALVKATNPAAEVRWLLETLRGGNIGPESSPTCQTASPGQC